MTACASVARPESLVFPRSNPPAKTLYHLDLMQAPLDMRFAMTVLQGLVNRSQPQLYVSQDPNWHGPMNFGRWMDDLRSRGYEFKDITPEDAIAQFGKVVKGAVLYESNLGEGENTQPRHKLNALTLYCSVNDCIPVTQEVNDKLKLPVVLDTRGKYTTPIQAYTWAYKEAWPKANRKIIAHTHPTHMVLRDYLVQHRVMPIWMSKGTNLEEDSMIQRFLREAEPGSPLMGCWGGYGEEPAGRYTEPDLQRIASEYGKYIVVSDGCFNTSVVSGLDYKRPLQKFRERPKLDRSKVYVVFHITDGDNLQWLQQSFISPQWWLDPNRGKVPISWSLNPIAPELIPNFVEYVQSTASPVDEFTCSTAGIGLVTPALYGRELTIDSEALYSRYLKLTNEAMKRVRQACIHLGDTSLVPWTRADFDRCAREMPAVQGILGDYGRMHGVFPDIADYTVSRDVVVLRTYTGVGPAKSDDERAQQIADGIRNQVPKSRPGFVHVCLVNWYVNPTSILKATELLGDEYVAVLPSEIVQLYREAKVK